jgi:hypothetical protein
MRLLQFRVRTLLLLTAVLGLVFVVCARWPVTQMVVTWRPSSESGAVFVSGGVRYQWRHVEHIKRLPTPAEFALRAGASSIVVGAIVVALAVVRRRSAL